ncbi:MAG: hypothetical protein DME52_08460 [Verrucomicrobia bacterium]|nr:MAG: hypothetical protein DME52_08460 [Verrucomicrobiota bacterium]
MKKKSASKSAFFNLRVLIGLFIVLAGVFLALAGFGTFSAIAANSLKAQQKHKIVNIQGLPPGFDCATIHEKGIDKMESMRAGLIMIACGEAQGGSASSAGAFSQLMQKLLPVPLAYGAGDVDLVTGTETPPHIIQSETYTTANPDNANQIGAAYNDSRCASSNNFSGASFSTDGGATFTRLTTGSGCSPFTNTFGDPVILYHKPSGTWLTVWIDANGGCTMGGYKSTTPTDPTSWTHFCVHSGISDDRESGWADNNPSSPHYGTMYISWNDFGQSEQIRATHSTDGGVTWSSPVNVNNTFIRNVQITGDDVTGDVYIAGMDEGGGGFPHNDTNLLYKSTDGGVTFTNTYTGTPFAGPGVCSSGYFAGMFTTNGCYWRHEGWGEPAAHNGIVHLVYDQQGTGGDPADTYYIRSTDGGHTFGTPLKLNTDATNRPNWQPNLSVSPGGTLFAVWYDARGSTSSDCVYGSSTSPCYQMWGRKSNDGGVTWLPDDTFSDVISHLPANSDPNIVPSYVGDYDYGSAITTKHVTSWVDGRVIISGQSQQDAFTDRELVGFSVTSTDPACNSFVVGTAPSSFVVNLSDAADPNSVQPSDFTVNGTPANMATLSNGNATITFTFNTSPVVQGSNTMHIAAGTILRQSDAMPIFDFTCTFHYGTTQLMVTTTNPPVGSTFTGPGMRDLEVDWNIPVDPTSVQAGDLMISGIPATVTGVDVSGGNMITTFHINFTGIFSGSFTASIAAGAITDTFGNPSAAFSGMYNYTGSVCDTGLIQNEGFETGTFPPWVIDGHTNDPVIATNFAHTGTDSAFAGGNPQQSTYCEENSNEPLGDSSFYQQFGPVPASAICVILRTGPTYRWT